MKRFYTQNINFPIILRMIGWLLMIEAGFMSIPLCVSLYYYFFEGVASELHVAWAFGYSVGITLATGFLMTTLIHPSTLSMQRREGFLLTAVTWVFFSAFGMLGFTTTGATVIRDVDHTAKGILFWRALTQWIGGMGIIVFTLAVLPMLNYKGGIALFNAEVPGITHERLRPRVSQSAKSLWGMYIILTAILAVLLMFGPMDWFDSVCQTMSTVSTGGFSTKTIGLGYWHNYYSDVMIMIFMFLCGTNFTLLFQASGGKLGVFWKSNTFKWYLDETVLVSVIIILRMWTEGFLDNWPDRILFSFFDTISGITSTGFSTYSYEKSGEFISFVLMIAMFFGGMTGSTAGGAKIDRMVVMLKNTRNEFYRALHPNAVTSVRVDGRAVPHDIVAKVIAFLCIYVLILVAVALVLSMMGLPIFDALFSSMSALSNVGFGYGLLSLEMMVGRLELFTVLVILTRDFWVKD